MRHIKILFVFVLLSFSVYAENLFIGEGESVVLSGDIIEGNVHVEGGSLEVKNFTTINGKVFILDGGSLNLHSSARINGPLLALQAKEISISRSKVTGKTLLIEIVDGITLSTGEFEGDFETKQSNLFASNSRFHQHVIVSKGETVFFFGPTFNGETDINHVEVTLVDNARINGDINFKNNNVAFIASSNLSANATMVKNETAVFTSNISTVLPGGVTISKNTNTEVTSNRISGTLIIEPGSGTCQMSGNVLSELIGGCN